MRAQEYDLNRHNKVKSPHSKMDNLSYNKLESQEYLKLKNCNSTQAKIIFGTAVGWQTMENTLGGLGALKCAPYAQILLTINHRDSLAKKLERN